MMMTLNRLISWLQYRVRAFLGLDVIPTRLELTEIRDEMAKNQRQILEILAKHVTTSLPERIIPNYQSPYQNWDNVQLLELAQMIANPPKED